MNKYPLTILFFISCIYHATFATHTFNSAFQQAGECFKNKQFADAVQLYRQAIALNPTSHQAYFNLGVSLFEQKNMDDAQKALRKALSIYPDYDKAYLYLGKIAKEYKQNSLAIKFLKKAFQLNPKSKEIVYLLVEALKNDLHVDEAVSYLRKAVLDRPNDINLRFTLANTLNMANHTTEALDLYLELNKIHPNDAGIIYNIAYTLKKLGRMQECLPHYDKALELKPDHTEAHFSQGLAYLVLGDFERGWKGYEYRWDRSDQLKKRDYSQPLWNGEDSLLNKTIFVYAEQGLGDTFQFIRYLKLLKTKGAHVVFAPQKPLMDLLKLCPYIDELIDFRAQPASFDYHIPLVSLPYLFKTRIDTVPIDIPYLYADESLTKEWEQKLAHDPNFKIGICWQGNSNYSTAFLRAAVAAKSMPVALFEPLTHIPHVSVYSLQHMTGTDQLQDLPETMKLITFDGDFDNSHGRFMDTAAVIKNLDLVITIDTSISHLAAALGKPVWNLLPNPPDWRWMLHCKNTPWYPNMFLFRQPKPGDWESSIQSIIQELQILMQPHNITLHDAVEVDTKTDSNFQLASPQVPSWGAVLNKLAKTRVDYHNTLPGKQKDMLGYMLHRMEQFAQSMLKDEIIKIYVHKLEAIHRHYLTTISQDAHIVLKDAQQNISAKIDLYIQICESAKIV